MFRVQIVEDRDSRGRLLKRKKIVGDSGWQKNQVTNIGIRDGIVQWIAAGASGSAVTHMALGTGTAPASDATSLNGEITDAASSRKTVSTSIVSSRTAQFTAAFASSASFVTATKNISNIGLFATSTTAAGTIIAGNTYASSSLATNQSVNATYQLKFASA